MSSPTATRPSSHRKNHTWSLPAVMARTTVHDLDALVANDTTPRIDDRSIDPARPTHRRRPPAALRTPPTTARRPPTWRAPGWAMRWRRAPTPARRRRRHARAVVIAKIETVGRRARCAAGKAGGGNQRHRERGGKGSEKTPVKHDMALHGTRGPLTSLPSGHLEELSTPLPLNRP